MTLPTMPEKFEKDGYSFRRVGEGDMQQISEWLAEPHIVEWWTPNNSELGEMQAEFGNAKPPVARYIVSHNARPFAYIQCYDPGDDSFWEENPQPDGTVGIDQFIGDPQMMGFGHGVNFLRTFIAELKGLPGVKRIIVDPVPDNKPAIRCFSQTGFRTEKEIDTPQGRALLMSQRVS